MRLPAVLNRTYEEERAIVRTRFQWVCLLAFVCLLFTMPLFVSGYTIALSIYILINVISALGLSLLMGYCGQISAGHAAFMALGAFGTGGLVTKLGFPFPLALLCGGLIAGTAGLIFGLPSLRIKGLYLALTTLAAQFTIIWGIEHFDSVTNGVKGLIMPSPQIGGLVFDTDRKMYYLVLIIAVVGVYSAVNIARSKIGRAFVAIRDNDIAAQAMGINPFPWKLLAFFISCFFGGVAGALWAYYAGLAATAHFGLWDTIWYVGMVVIGGMGSIGGTIFGVLFVRMLFVLTYWLAGFLAAVLPLRLAETINTGLSPLVFGPVLILFLILEPRGLAHRWQIVKSYVRLWPFAY